MWSSLNVNVNVNLILKELDAIFVWMTFAYLWLSWSLPSWVFKNDENECKLSHSTWQDSFFNS